MPAAIDSHNGTDSSSETASRFGCRMTASPWAKRLDEPGHDPCEPCRQYMLDAERGAAEAFRVTGEREQQDETRDRRSGRQQAAEFDPRVERGIACQRRGIHEHDEGAEQQQD